MSQQQDRNERNDQDGQDIARHERDAACMRRAIELAGRASGLVTPNPLVGAVIADEHGIVGEGWHRGVGERHAETDALIAAGARARGATAYVTLEPCHHVGRTPPCTAALVDAGIARVVYAVTDPNPIAAGGAAALAAAGIRVDGGVEEISARYLARAFLHHVETGRPWVIAKFATSLDGRIATHAAHSRWITGAAARRAGHRSRQAVDAILVGAGTVLADDPSLTVRLPDDDALAGALRHPRPVLLDSHGTLPVDGRLLSGSQGTRALHVVSDAVAVRDAARLARSAAELVVCPADPDTGRVAIPALLDALGARRIQSLLVEGGASVHGAFLDADAIDEVHAYLAPMLIGGSGAPPAIGGRGASRLDDALRLDALSVQRLGDDVGVSATVRRERRSVLAPRFTTRDMDDRDVRSAGSPAPRSIANEAA